ncbi:MAG: glycerophosphoryl diester phosphodiesterase [Proteobacteria bacterium]|nr:glycerophosphoryl diester phosphodiesterase [Pseudomonadota bacterium]
MLKQDFTPPRPSYGLIGHRGISTLAPENTLASFELVSKKGFNWVEFDLRLTADNHLIIFHDDTLERTTNGNGFVHEQNWEDLSTLDAGHWFDPCYQGEKIPLFSKILPRLIQLNLYLNIELKIPCFATQIHQKTLIHQLKKALLSYWPKAMPWPLISSFHWDLILELRNFIPDVPIGFLQETCTLDLVDLVAKTPNAALHCDYRSLDETFLAKASKQIPILAYTINEPEIAIKLLNAGVYGIFSDNPHELQKMHPFPP